MNSRDRLIATVAGTPTDRVPFTAWHHFRLDPPAGGRSRMAEEQLAFYRSFEPDLLKVMHDVPYEPVGPIETVDDWRKLTVLDPEDGNFGAQLYTLDMIRTGLDDDVPMIDTVFGVYYYADKLSGKRLLDHLREDPHKVHAGLETIAESLVKYAGTTLRHGCEGIYYALSGASSEGATREEYQEHFLKYDRAILESVQSAPLNILHLHGYDGLYFDITHTLPASAVCWSDRTGGPSLLSARHDHAGCLMGGIDETRFENMSVDEVIGQSREAINEMGGRNFILAPGCSVPDYCDPNLLRAIATAAKELKPQAS